MWPHSLRFPIENWDNSWWWRRLWVSGPWVQCVYETVMNELFNICLTRVYSEVSLLKSSSRAWSLFLFVSVKPLRVLRLASPTIFYFVLLFALRPTPSSFPPIPPLLISSALTPSLWSSLPSSLSDNSHCFQPSLSPPLWLIWYTDILPAGPPEVSRPIWTPKVTHVCV